MAKLISIHSFRHGAGKSNLAANLAVLMACAGQRVGVMDTNAQGPSIHLLFGVDDGALRYGFDDYLLGVCAIGEAAYRVTPQLNRPIPGEIVLLPATLQSGEPRIPFDSQAADQVGAGLQGLLRELALDLLLIDTNAGLEEASLVTIALSDTLIMVMPLDQLDYQGTGVALELARRLEVPRRLLVVNRLPASFNGAVVRAHVEQAFDCEVAAVLPHSDELMALASSGLFALQYPYHPLTALLTLLAAKLVA